MTRELKVYGTTTMCPLELREKLCKPYRVQARAIVAAYSLTAAVKLLQMNRAYVGVTGNAQELAVALAAPGTVFYGAADHQDLGYHALPISEPQ